MLLPIIMVLGSGCSTITGSETQTIALTSTFENKAVEADCKIKNDKGSWDSKTPSVIAVRKSNEDLDIVCKKEGVPDGMLKAISRAAGSMFGNILFGGGIGAIIDHNKGTGYDYPTQLTVKMGESVVADKQAEQQATQTSSCSPGQC